MKDRKVFREVAEFEGADRNIVVPVKSGLDALKIVKSLKKNSLDHLVIAGHGGPNWLLNPHYGIVNFARKKTQIDVSEFSKALDIASKDNLLVSIAACLCSRSPSWYLRLTRNLGSDWGPRGYGKGGIKSFSGILRNNLFYYGTQARVRGHRVAGHAADCSILAEHAPPPQTPCSTLFQRSLVGIEPTLRVRRWWVKNVTGELAQRWLFGDDTVESEISVLYNEWNHYS